MKICFVQKQNYTYFGITSLIGYLKPLGHECHCLIYNLEQDLIKELKKLDVDIVGISVLTSEHEWLVKITQFIKKALPDKPIIIGGVHAILYPEILTDTSADFLCACEGEIVLEQLLNILKEKNLHKSLSKIPGLVYRTSKNNNSELAFNALQPLLPSIDWPEDRSAYYRRYPILANETQKEFMSSRGCPYSCYFCFNLAIRERFRGFGRYCRRKSVDSFLNDIKAAVLNYGSTKSIFFIDDLFLIDKKWLSDFAGKYKTQIGIPFLCQIHPRNIDDEVAKLLHETGCHTVCMGVETGNEVIRHETLNKKVTNREFLNAAAIIKKHNIRLKVANMFGIPGETVEQALETIKFDIELGADFAGTSMLLPFPGTQIEKSALEKGWLTKPLNFRDLPESAYNKSAFNNVSHMYILHNIMSVTQLSILFPFMFGFLRRIVYFRFSPLFKLLNFTTFFTRYMYERKISFFDTFKILWSYRKSI